MVRRARARQHAAVHRLHAVAVRPAVLPGKGAGLRQLLHSLPGARRGHRGARRPEAHPRRAAQPRAGQARAAGGARVRQGAAQPGWGGVGCPCLPSCCRGERSGRRRPGLALLHACPWPHPAVPLLQVCILRRLQHPNIIACKDVFLRPSATGQVRSGGLPGAERAPRATARCCCCCERSAALGASPLGSLSATLPCCVCTLVTWTV